MIQGLLPNLEPSKLNIKVFLEGSKWRFSVLPNSPAQSASLRCDLEL